MVAKNIMTIMVKVALGFPHKPINIEQVLCDTVSHKTCVSVIYFYEPIKSNTSYMKLFFTPDLFINI